MGFEPTSCLYLLTDCVAKVGKRIQASEVKRFRESNPGLGRIRTGTIFIVVSIACVFTSIA